MASSVGRIALGLVGAAIGAPFGMSAIGFSIGSAVGGMLFAPDGPHTEGPRLGDTAVAASSLGKVIAEHFGVVRTAGNVVWSAGLQEIKTTEEVDTGGKGANGPTQTTYTYTSSFASALGYGKATQIRKIWADGKLIYDGTSGSDTDNSKYTWRLRSGGPGASIDPLIQESINRRLAGLPDISDGNQDDIEYTTITDLIAASYEDASDRSQMYAERLESVKTSAESGLAPGAIPNYGFTPAYRGIALVIFDAMDLTDFGNRIPNITCEVVWDGAYSGNGLNSAEANAVPVGTAVTEIAPTTVPGGFMAVDSLGGKVFAHAGGTLRRFSGETKTEDRQTVLSPTSVPYEDHEGVPEINQYGYTVTRLVAALPSGDAVAVGTRVLSGDGGENPSQSDQTTFILSKSGLEPIGPALQYLASVAYGTAVFVGGSYPVSSEQPSGDTGDHLATITGSTITVSRFLSGALTDTASIEVPAGLPASTGPMTHAEKGEEAGGANFLVSRFDSNTIWLGKYLLENRSIIDQELKPSLLSEWAQGNLLDYLSQEYAIEDKTLRVSLKDSETIPNPFPASITAISGVIQHTGTGDFFVLVALSGGDSGIMQVDDALEVVYSKTISNATPPLATSGITRSDVTNNTLAFASGQDIIKIDLVDGSFDRYVDAIDAPASANAQAYFAFVGGLLLWKAGAPFIYSVGEVGGASRGHDISALLPDVITKICKRAGMSNDEFDVSGVSNIPVRGYTIARSTTGRQALETLLQAFFVDAVETDWKVTFADRSTETLRTINEKELGEISSPTGAVNWLESRTPEYAIPSEINLNFADPLRDYQTGTAHKRRISNPIPAMYSNNITDIELPLVMHESEALAIAESLLYLSWMSRDSSKSVMNWTHADLDPGDVISVVFDDGRTITDRIASATLGADFSIEMESGRYGDPVYDTAPQSVIPTGAIPSVTRPRAVSSEMFVFDIPLLYDYHETGRASARYYTAVGSESPKWSSATIFQSYDGNSYAASSTVDLDVTWGSVLGRLKAPRALWATDRENVLRVTLTNDRGDVTSVTRDDILNGANRAFVYNRATGIGEIIQFQTVTIENGGSVLALSNLVRGVRGTEYACGTHRAGETFILLKEARIQNNTVDLAALGGTGYFKAVSSGQIISGVSPVRSTLAGRSLMPYAPSRVRRADAGSGGVEVSWNRRTRVGGGWAMGTVSETVPLNEDSEKYELYLLPSGDAAFDTFDPTDTATYLLKVAKNVANHTLTASQLAAVGMSSADDLNVAVYQVSAQVGRGFQAAERLIP